jgi:hypothetical protein
MHTITRLGAAILALAACAAGPAFAGPTGVEIAPEVRIYGGAAEQIDLGRWAVRRFEAAGLTAPAVEIHFHAGRSGCKGNIGWAEDGRIDVCTTMVNTYSRRVMLHEIGHTWLDANVDDSLRERFLELRGLRAWNATSDPWRLRGYEQAAEVMAWGLGERIITPTMSDSAPPAIAVAYELLTGSAMPVW